MQNDFIIKCRENKKLLRLNLQSLAVCMASTVVLVKESRRILVHDPVISASFAMQGQVESVPQSNDVSVGAERDAAAALLTVNQSPSLEAPIPGDSVDANQLSAQFGDSTAGNLRWLKAASAVARAHSPIEPKQNRILTLDRGEAIAFTNPGISGGNREQGSHDGRVLRGLNIAQAIVAAGDLLRRLRWDAPREAHCWSLDCEEVGEHRAATFWALVEREATDTLIATDALSRLS
jgi:hypothetical protein